MKSLLTIKTDVNLFATLVLISFFPGFYYIVMKASSLAAGLFMAACVALVINFNYDHMRLVNKKKFATFFFVSFVLVTYSLMLFLSTGHEKPLTVVLLIIIFISMFSLAKKLERTSYEAIDEAFKLMIVLLIVVGWLGYSQISIHGLYLEKEKAVPPFAEQSHYALCLGLFSLAYSFIASRKFFVFMFANSAALSLLFPNLTLLVYTVLMFAAALTRMKPKYFLLSLTVFPILTIQALLFLVSKFEYFSSRLSFTDTSNLTTLVWLQGWDLAYKSLLSTHGVGLGFQMLGLEETQLTEIAERIEKISGGVANVGDGGFLAAKIISEFGVVGAVIATTYIIFIGYFILKLGASLQETVTSSQEESLMNKKKILLQGTVFAFLVEFFFRGYGYFSPGLYFVMAALMAKKSMELYGYDHNENNSQFVRTA